MGVLSCSGNPCPVGGASRQRQRPGTAPERPSPGTEPRASPLPRSSPPRTWAAAGLWLAGQKSSHRIRGRSGFRPITGRRRQFGGLLLNSLVAPLSLGTLPRMPRKEAFTSCRRLWLTSVFKECNSIIRTTDGGEKRKQSHCFSTIKHRPGCGLLMLRSLQ